MTTDRLGASSDGRNSNSGPPTSLNSVPSRRRGWRRRRRSPAFDVLAGGVGDAATKHAVLGLTRIAPIDAAPYGILVNAGASANRMTWRGGRVSRLRGGRCHPRTSIKLGPNGNRQSWFEDTDGARIEMMEIAPSGLQQRAIALRRAGG